MQEIEFKDSSKVDDDDEIKNYNNRMGVSNLVPKLLKNQLVMVLMIQALTHVFRINWKVRW